MKRMALCMLAVLLVAVFPTPGAADQLPGSYAADMISSNFANATCGQAFVSQPTYVGGVQTRPGNITINVDFTNSLTTPVVNPPLASGNCSTTIPLLPGASFDVCYLTLGTSPTVTYITTVTDTNKNGRIDGGESFLSGDFLPHGNALASLLLFAPADATCGGTLQFQSGFHRR